MSTAPRGSKLPDEGYHAMGLACILKCNMLVRNPENYRQAAAGTAEVDKLGQQHIQHDWVEHPVLSAL